MPEKTKLVLKKAKKEPIVYAIKADNEILWEGKDLHKRFKDIKATNKDRQLTVCWRSSKENISV